MESEKRYYADETGHIYDANDDVIVGSKDIADRLNALEVERAAMEALLVRVIEDHGMDIMSELEDAIAAIVCYDKDGKRLWQNPALTKGGDDE